MSGGVERLCLKPNRSGTRWSLGRGSTTLRGISSCQFPCSSVFSFCILAFPYPFVPACLMLYVVLVCQLTVWLLVWGPRTKIITTHRPCNVSLGRPSGSHAKSLNFKLGSEAPQLSPMCPKDTNNKKTSHLKSAESKKL